MRIPDPVPLAVPMQLELVLDPTVPRQVDGEPEGIGALQTMEGLPRLQPLHPMQEVDGVGGVSIPEEERRRPSIHEREVVAFREGAEQRVGPMGIRGEVEGETTDGLHAAPADGARRGALPGTP